ncbi:MAG: hypothetical protein PVI90_00105 [Desulfobacteraceae bacterium]|jgi:hypothetical protein
MKWNQLQSTTNVVMRIAKQALRAQQLLMAQQLQQTEAMINIHKTTNNKEKLEQIECALVKARYSLLKGNTYE